ncbi:DUF5979 domain-containing protein [Corynebacterium kutscheri]|uniref:LPxTG domain-containing protein n=1 Tax=Corynebacterium kutscheri TaxID=35755 RepID=A0AB38VQI6_9CORY|nr:DUF5979 domain-containing protein [Corynebacterium kutscheri]VEH05202.1 LPxTG domain-containing protein [Corynebacterium kutscheri]
MNHSPTKRKTSQGLLHSPWLAILFTLLLIASLVPLAINFSHSATAQETALSETTDNPLDTVEDTTVAVDDATAGELPSDDAETQPSDQLPVEEATATEDPQEAPAGTTETDEEPSFVEKIAEFFKGVFKPAEQKTAEEQKTTTGTFSLEQKITINGKPASTEPNFKSLEGRYHSICTKNGEATRSDNFSLTGDANYKSNSFPADTQCTIYLINEAPNVEGYTRTSNVTVEGGNGSFGVEANFTIKAGEETNVTVEYAYAKNGRPTPTSSSPAPEPETGRISLIKQVKDNTAKEKLKDKEFSFQWQCTTNNAIVKQGTTKLADQEAIVLEGLPLNSSCTIKETDIPQLDGYTHSLEWLTNEDSKGSENPITVTPRKKNAKTPLTVTAVNTYTPVDDKQETGQFTLEKKVEGLEEKDKDKEFEFTWQCTDDASKVTRGNTKLKNNGKHTVTGLPLNSTCKVSETNTNIPGYTHSIKWKTNGEDKVAPNGVVSVDPRKADKKPPVVTAVNTYTKDDKPAPTTTSSSTAPKPEDKQGKFRVSKSAVIIKKDGTHGYDDKKFGNRDFAFTWECTPPTGKGNKQTGSFTVKATGAFRSENLPVGTTCTVTEDENSARFDGFTHKLVVDDKQVKQKNNTFSFTINSEQVFTIDARNEYTPGVPPVTPTTSKPAPTTTTSSTTSAKPTTTTSTEPIVPTTTSKFPPIIPIPIPIPVPPAPFPPAPAPAPAPAPNGGNNSPAPGVTTAPHHGGNNTAQPQQNNARNTTSAAPGQVNKGKGLANTGASVIWLAFVAVLLAAVGGFITYRSRANKNN